MIKRILGQMITAISTLGSMYDKGSYLKVWFELDGKVVEGRMKTSTVLMMVNEFVFDVSKAHKYYHLVSPVRIENADKEVVSDAEVAQLIHRGIHEELEKKGFKI